MSVQRIFVAFVHPDNTKPDSVCVGAYADKLRAQESVELYANHHHGVEQREWKIGADSVRWSLNTKFLMNPNMEASGYVTTVVFERRGGEQRPVNHRRRK